MLSIHGLKAGRTAVGIAEYLEEADAADYYSEGGFVKAVWAGLGRHALGLSDIGYERDSILPLLDGYGPNGEKLARIDPQNHRSGWDLTFSAPKSVSAVWAVARDAHRDEIEKAHDQAVQSALKHIEQQGYVSLRSGRAGQEREAASRLIAATFRHGASRAGEPDLHSHLLLINLAQTSSGAWRRLDPAEIYRRKIEIGAVYRAELADQMRRLGYQVVRDRTSFKLSDISQELCDRWSTRSKEIEAALGGLATSGKAKAVAALDSRAAKLNMPGGVQRALWREQAASYGFQEESLLALRAKRPALEELALDFTLAELTRQNSIFTDRDLKRQIALEAQCRANAAETAQFQELALHHPDLVALRDEKGRTFFTTKEMLALETSLLDGAVNRPKEKRYQVAQSVVEAAAARGKAERGFDLNDEQRSALHHITRGADSIAMVQGVAGAGKTTLLYAARCAWEEAGFRVRGVAIARKAADELTTGSAIPSTTLARLLVDLEESPAGGPARTKLTSKDVIVLDEAGMEGSRQMKRLLDAAALGQAKIVLIGDERQLQAIEAGGIFRALARRLGAAQITISTRQRDDIHRDAVAKIRAGEIAEALEYYRSRDSLEIGASNGVEEAVSRWHAARREVGATQALLVTSRHSAARALNLEARRLLGLEGSGVIVAVTDRESKPNGTREIAPGDRVVARRNSNELRLANGQFLTVQDIYGEGPNTKILALKDNGERIEIDTARYASLDHGYAVTIHSGQGTTVERTIMHISDPSMVDIHSTYVGASRSRERTEIVVSRYALEEAAILHDQDIGNGADQQQDLTSLMKAMARERLKEVSVDYEVME